MYLITNCLLWNLKIAFEILVGQVVFRVMNQNIVLINIT